MGFGAFFGKCIAVGYFTSRLSNAFILRRYESNETVFLFFKSLDVTIIICVIFHRSQSNRSL